MTWSWASGNGGGALAVVLDERGKAFGWLCDEGSGTTDGQRTDCFKWWLTSGESGESEDYDAARAAMGRAADARLEKKKNV